VLFVFAAAILLSAALLFTVQPLVAKMLLPLLGGAPSVWNTCMVFFQAGLLAGYAYAHLLTRRLSARAQLTVHGVVLLLPFAALPFAVPGAGPEATGTSPIVWLLASLALSAGLPFFAVSTTGPLLQRWLAVTDHPSARDPYFLYAASNVGSLGGLLAYPLVLEANFRLGVLDAASSGAGSGWSQGAVWTAGYALFVVLALGAGAAMVTRHLPAAALTSNAASTPAVPWRRALLWLVLALVPSSTLLGTTQFLTTDMAAVPLLWVVPLALYLATFIVAFSGRFRVPPAVSGTIAGILILGIAVTTSPDLRLPLWASIALHLGTLFFAALACHQRLADTRPAPDHLTFFYLVVALGGVLGGAFNGLLGPVLFENLFEYPLALVAVCLLRAPWREEGPPRRPIGRALDAVIPAAILLYGFAVWRMLPLVPERGDLLEIWLRIGLPAAFALATIGWRTRYALSIAVVFLLAWRQLVGTADLDYSGRTFFGVMRVVTVDGAPYKIDESSGLVFRIPYRVLIHGGTRHGTQALDPRMSNLPTTYYHPTGPAGQLFETFGDDPRFDRVAVVGLGVGTLAAYGREGQRFSIYEIDPEVIHVARDTGLFTYLNESGAEIEYVIGDGRLSLARAEDGSFGLIALDAFSSDSIPVHLITRDALALCFRKLRPDGIVLVNITNRYLEFEPVLAAIAHDLGLSVRIRRDFVESSRQAVEGKDASVWAVLARDDAALGALAKDARWTIASAGEDPPPRRYLWTDDYSNLFAVIDLR
jgi:SAM-dependent methyltransferase